MKDRMKNTFDRICAEEELKDKTREFLTEKTKGYTKRRTFSYKYVVTAAVCLLLILAGGCWTYFMPTAAISIDINPSLELGVNRFGRVVSVHAWNQDGKGLADSLNIKFMDYERAVEEILENRNVAELLSEDEVMTIAVIGSGGRQCRRMLSRLAACTSGRRNAYCYFASSDEVEKAHEAGLSYGKYRALLKLQELDPDITAEDIQGMTMREIRDWILRLSPDQKGAQDGGEGYGHRGQGNGNGHGMGNGTRHCLDVPLLSVIL